MAVSEFDVSLHAAKGRTEENDHYEEFMAIVNEYIRDKSASEINIDSNTKQRILDFGERSAYASLGMVRGSDDAVHWLAWYVLPITRQPTSCSFSLLD